MNFFDRIKKKLDEEEPVSPQEMPQKYAHWWLVQKATILMCILFLVTGIIVHWAFVIISFLFLGYNLLANYRRVRLLRRMQALGIEPKPDRKREI
jgi:hypothetical protein